MYPKAYIDYLIYYHVDRDYFECHEVLEEHWKLDPQGSRKAHWVALIQLAVGLYHHRRGNIKGAEIMYKRSAVMMTNESEPLIKLGLNTEDIIEQINNQISTLHSQDDVTFNDINLPIIDDALVRACEKRCKELACEWKINSSTVNDEILHKHTRRDLDSVKAERAKQLALRQANRLKKH